MMEQFSKILITELSEHDDLAVGDDDYKGKVFST